MPSGNWWDRGIPEIEGGPNNVPDAVAVGDTLYADAAPSWQRLPGNTTTTRKFLRQTGNGSISAAPVWDNIALTTDVSGILPGANGGTGNGFFAVAGPATALKTFTFPDASATVLTTNAAVTVAQGGIGVATLAANGVLYGNGTGVVLVTAQGPANSVLTANAGAPVFSATPQLTRLGIGGAADAVHILAVTGGTVTADTHLLDMTQTWNNGAITFAGLKLNITDTASAAASLLEDLQVGGASKWKVDKAGLVTAAGNLAFLSGTAFSVTFDHGATANRIMTVPDVADDTLALLAAAQTLSAKTLSAPVINDATNASTVDMGGGTGNATFVGVANINSTAVGNVGVGEDDLITYTLPVSSLNANGKTIRIRAWGTAANNANAKTVKVYFGTAVILTTALTVSVADSWWVEALVTRTGASTQDAVARLEETGANAMDMEVSTATQTDTAAIVIKLTGTATTDNDIVQEGLLVEFLN